MNRAQLMQLGKDIDSVLTRLQDVPNDFHNQLSHAKQGESKTINTITLLKTVTGKHYQTPRP
jgi:hypothetical protein